MQEHYTEMSTVAQKVTVAGAGGGLFFGGLSINQWAAIVSAAAAVIGMAFSIYFQYQRNKIMLLDRVKDNENDDELSGD